MADADGLSVGDAMDNSDSMVRFLAIAVLAASSIAAFCVSLMGYTFATGDLPFGMKPLFAASEDKTGGSARAPNRPTRETRQREAESAVAALYEEINAERERVNRDREEIAEQRYALDQVLATAGRLQQELEKQAKTVQDMFLAIDAQEKENAKRVANLVASAQIKEGARMLLMMEEKAAAQVIFYLPPKLSGPLLAEILKAETPENAGKAGRIIELVRRLTDKEPS